MTGSPATTNHPYPSPTLQLNSDYDDNDSDPELDPSESMSQFGTFDIKASPSALSHPPEVEASEFDITAGGPEPAFYQMRLQEAQVIPARGREDEHEYLDEIFRDLVSYSRFFYNAERYES